jgi:aryl-alcohol dehydrogenase-like predicted oxidoreductase
MRYLCQSSINVTLCCFLFLHGYLQIFLATKFGAFLDGKGGIGASNQPDYIRSAIMSSLERLQTDYIDLYYCHNFTGEIPIEEVTSILAEFVK